MVASSLSIAKRGAKGVVGGKKRKKPSFSSYSSYVHALMKKQFGTTKGTKKTKLRGAVPSHRVNVAITSRGMGIVNSFIVDLFGRLAEEAGRASQFAQTQTLQSGAVMAAVKMHFPPEMAQHAVTSGVAAVASYTKALEAKPGYKARLAKREAAKLKKKET